jgi:isopentenyl phosphate kinase
MTRQKLVFVKLGGAAITDKSKPRTALIDNIAQLAQQIARALQENPKIQVVLGHGSGSFGHFSGQKYDTRNGVIDHQGWLGFAEVWDDARQLNELVIHAFLKSGLPVIAFPPSAWLITENREPVQKQIIPIQSAIQNGLIPVVNGDVIFDTVLGGTILSTEEIFSLLADELQPDQIILASREPGVWEDYPSNTKLSLAITPLNLRKSLSGVKGAVGTDVTGGMAKKVAIMMEILQRHSKIQISITSGMDTHSVYDALIDRPSGTLLHSE